MSIRTIFQIRLSGWPDTRVQPLACLCGLIQEGIVTSLKMISPAVVILAAIALVATCGTGSEAHARKAVKQSAVQAPAPQPVKMRYYGGPKSPMYPG
jgi:hypothetical protein